MNLIGKVVSITETSDGHSVVILEKPKTSTALSRLCDKTLEEIEREHIKHVIDFAPTLSDAGVILGINPSTLWRKRKQYGLL